CFVVCLFVAGWLADLEWAFRVEELFKQNRDTRIPASQYLAAKPQLDMDLIEVLKSQGAAVANGGHAAPAAALSPTSPASSEPAASPASPSPQAASQNGFEASPVVVAPASPSPVAQPQQPADEPLIS